MLLVPAASTAGWHSWHTALRHGHDGLLRVLLTPTPPAVNSTEVLVLSFLYQLLSSFIKGAPVYKSSYERLSAMSNKVGCSPDDVFNNTEQTREDMKSDADISGIGVSCPDHFFYN